MLGIHYTSWLLIQKSGKTLIIAAAAEPWNEDEFISVRFVATNERMAARLWEIGMKL
jgi:hypothetical protein